MHGPCSFSTRKKMGSQKSTEKSWSKTISGKKNSLPSLFEEKSNRLKMASSAEVEKKQIGREGSNWLGKGKRHLFYGGTFTINLGEGEDWGGSLKEKEEDGNDIGLTSMETMSLISTTRAVRRRG